MRELQVLGNGHLKLNLADCKEFFTQELSEMVRGQLQRLIEEALPVERDRYLNLGPLTGQLSPLDATLTKK